MIGTLVLRNGSTSAGWLDFHEDSDDGANKVRLLGPAVAGDIVLTLPPTDGDANEVLATDGSGVMSWVGAWDEWDLAYDSAVVHSPLVNEAKDSLTSFANKVNSSHDHVSADGSSHTYIDQSVVSGASPTFESTNIAYKDGETVPEIFDEIVNAGVLGTISVVDDGAALNITWGAGLVYDPSGNIVSTTGGNGSVTNDAVTYLFWSTGTTLTLSTTAADLGDVPVSTIWAQNNDIWFLHNESINSNMMHHIRHGLGELFPVAVANGLIVSNYTDITSDMDVIITAGKFYADAHNEHAVAEINSETTPLRKWSHTGGAWVEHTAINVTAAYYDNLTDTVAVSPSGRWVRSVFLISETEIHWVYPQELHNSEAAAETGSNPIIPPGLAGFPIVAACIMQGSETDLANAVFLDIRPTLVGGGGTGAHVSDHGNLSGLSDDDHPQYGVLSDNETITGNWINTDNPWSVPDGGTGAATFTDGGVLLGSGTSPVSNTGVIASGALIIGDGVGDPVTAVMSGDAAIATNGVVTVADDSHNHVYSNIDQTTSTNWRSQVSDATGTGAWVFGTSPTFTTDITTPLVIGGTGTTSDLSLKTTSGVGASGADMHFLVGNDGATEAMTILNNGKVGVGISSPNSILHIKANTPGTVGSHPAGQLIIQNPNSGATANAVIVGYESDVAGDIEQQLWYAGSSAGSNYDITFLNRYAANLTLGTAGVTRFIIDAFGNIGIGDATPAALLTVGDGDDFQVSTTGGVSTTGTVDWGGATSLEIPNVNNPTTNAVGEIAWDADDDAIEGYLSAGGDTESALIATGYKQMTFLVEAPGGIADTIMPIRLNDLVYPHGIEIDSVWIDTDSVTTYSVIFVERVTAGTYTTISTIATSGSYYASEAPDTDADIAAQSKIGVVLPATEASRVTCGIVFHIKDGD